MVGVLILSGENEFHPPKGLPGLSGLAVRRQQTTLLDVFKVHEAFGPRGPLNTAPFPSQLACDPARISTWMVVAKAFRNVIEYISILSTTG